MKKRNYVAMMMALTMGLTFGCTAAVSAAEDVTEVSLWVLSQEEYYLNLRNFRDKYFDVGSKEWEEYTIEILTYCKKLRILP